MRLSQIIDVVSVVSSIHNNVIEYHVPRAKPYLCETHPIPARDRPDHDVVRVVETGLDGQQTIMEPGELWRSESTLRSQ